MQEFGRIVGGAILVGVVLGGAAMFNIPVSQRTFKKFLEYFFSAIAASFVLGAIWYGIGRWTGFIPAQ